MRRGLFPFLLTVALLAAAAPAGASHIPPKFYSLGVPAQDTVPERNRLYATLGGVGNGTQLGDPVIPATRNGGTYNPRSDWMPIDPRYPNLPEEVVTGSTGDCKLLPVPHCGFSGGQGDTRGARAKLVSRWSGKCLTVSGLVRAGAPINQQTCRPSDPKQTWYLSVHISDGKFTVAPVYWYQAGNLYCLGPANRLPGRQLELHRRLRYTETCPHWVIKHRITGNWRTPFVRPF
jgi:hypothetical protein